MSTMRPSGLVKAKPRRMSMPNDDSTPEMFENRNGWSCVRTVSSQPASLALEPGAGPHRGRGRATAGRGGRPPRARTAAGSGAAGPARNASISSAVRSAGRRSTTSACADWSRSITSSPYDERQVVVGVDVQPPEQLLLPRRQRLAADRLDVGQRHAGRASSAALRRRPARRTAGRSPDPRCRAGTRRATSSGAAPTRNSTVVARLLVEMRAARTSAAPSARSRRRGRRRVHLPTSW